MFPREKHNSTDFQIITRILNATQQIQQELAIDSQYFLGVISTKHTYLKKCWKENEKLEKDKKQLQNCILRNERYINRINKI